MAEDAGEQLAGTDRSNPSAAPKSIAAGQGGNRRDAQSHRGHHRPHDRPAALRVPHRALSLSAVVGLPDSLSAPDWSPLPASRFC